MLRITQVFSKITCENTLLYDALRLEMISSRSRVEERTQQRDELSMLKSNFFKENVSETFFIYKIVTFFLVIFQVNNASCSDSEFNNK